MIKLHFVPKNRILYTVYWIIKIKRNLLYCPSCSDYRARKWRWSQYMNRHKNRPRKRKSYVRVFRWPFTPVRELVFHTKRMSVLISVLKTQQSSDNDPFFVNRWSLFRFYYRARVALYCTYALFATAIRLVFSAKVNVYEITR